MRRISFCFTVSMLAVMLLLTMSAAPVLANDNHRGERNDREDRDRNDGIDNTFFGSPFLGFDDLVDLNDDECDFDFDGICDDEEDVDIDQFSVGAFDCFAVTEEDNGEEDLEDVFCVPPTGGAPIEVV